MPRDKPYTKAGIKRVKCEVCRRDPGFSQWQCCADGSQYRVLCKRCDYELNSMVMFWANFKDVDFTTAMMNYRKKVFGNEDQRNPQ